MEKCKWRKNFEFLNSAWIC